MDLNAFLPSLRNYKMKEVCRSFLAYSISLKVELICSIEEM